jgi:molecular chaperone GrpE (heat shock protein)
MGKEKQEDYQEMKDTLLRTQANYENFRKQTEKRVDEITLMAGKNIILKILPILDNFELALRNAPKSDKQDLISGIELIYSQLHNILEEEGVKKIEVKENFDPYYHEALMKVPSEKPENTIIEELQKGYTLNDKVIRHSKVKLSAGGNKNESE